MVEFQVVFCIAANGTGGSCADLAGSVPQKLHCNAVLVMILAFQIDLCTGLSELLFWLHVLLLCNHVLL